MGYFNYFIKCIIRNVTYKLCKPKVFFTILLSVLIILLLHNIGYCTDSAWTEADVDFVNNMLNSISLSNDDIASINGQMSYNIQSKLEDIKSKMDNENSNLLEIKQELIELNNNVSDILTQLTGESSTFSFPLRGLLYCESIPDLDYGADVQNFQIVQGNINCGIYKIDYSFKSGTTYTFSFDGSYDGTDYSHVYYTYDDAVIGATITAYYAGTYNANNLNFSITPEKDCTITLLVRNSSALTGSLGNWVVTGAKQGLIEELQNTLNSNKQLQEESNQLQQEQNDFLKQETSDNDISIDSFNSVDSNDITSDGLSDIFNTIYSSINSWNSKDIVLPVPFTNKSITIQANYTNNMLNSVGGQTLINIVSTIYYFLVARFIIYSITGIINSIKSGSILETDTKNNITTEML